MDIYFLSTLFLLGLLSLSLGSFISVITYRIPRGEGFVKGRSYCDNCKSRLLWYDNIPLLSFIFYKGKSRCCNKNISVRYPLIEIASLLGSLLIFILTGNFWLLLVFYITLVIVVFDLEYQIIPDELSFLLLAVGILVNFNSLYSSFFIGLLSSSLLILLNLITNGRGMGLGDVKLAIGLGLWFNFLNSMNWLLVSFLTGGVIASILLLRGRAKLKTKIAFGPFLIVGFWVVLLMTRLNLIYN